MDFTKLIERLKEDIHLIVGDLIIIVVVLVIAGSYLDK